MLGLAVGALLTSWLWLRDSPPAHIENWRTGATGERRTAKALTPLVGAGWCVVHDMAAERGNHDHVVVGPGGVFQLNSKQLSGIASVRDDVVRLERPDHPRATSELPQLARSTRGAAASLSADLHRLTGKKGWVHAVIVLWGDFPDELVEGVRVAFVAGYCAAEWLAEHPKQLAAERVDALTAAVSALPRAA